MGGAQIYFPIKTGHLFDMDVKVRKDKRNVHNNETLLFFTLECIKHKCSMQRNSELFRKS